MSRMVCCRMSSGSSVFSIMPPKSARIDRFILIQSPISASSSNHEIFNLSVHGPPNSQDLATFICTTHMLKRFHPEPKNQSSLEYSSTLSSLPHTACHYPIWLKVDRPISRLNCIPSQ